MSTPIRSIHPLGFPWKTQDPFLFCVHHVDAYPRGNDELGPAASLAGRNIGQDFAPQLPWRMYHGSQVPGFPAHPHRGFETVTVATQGVIDHSDSLGAAGRFGNGDVQWMTAGSGVQHCEMFPLLRKDQDNPLELFQIWLNLPRARKMATPYFSMLWSDTIPTHTHTDAYGATTKIRVIAGQVADKKAPAPAPDSWAAKRENDVAIWVIRMDARAQWTLPPADSTTNRSLFYYEGKSATVAGQSFGKHQAFELVADQPVELVAGDAPVSFLLLQGKPIGEPVVQYGPFVMNTEGEIRQAMMEYQRTQFGGWPWPDGEHVHDRSRGRFALYPDGRLEERPL